MWKKQKNECIGRIGSRQTQARVIRAEAMGHLCSLRGVAEHMFIFATKTYSQAQKITLM